MVFENLLHRILKPGHGNSRRTAGLPRLHLLHGHQDIRALRIQVLLAQPGGIQGQVHQGPYRRGHLGRGQADREGEDTLVKRPITIPFDMVIHAIGMDPNVENPSISETFGVDLEEHGYIDVAHRYGAMGETSRPGIYVAGSATGPETIDDSIAQGHACAMAVLSNAKNLKSA